MERAQRNQTVEGNEEMKSQVIDFQAGKPFGRYMLKLHLKIVTAQKRVEDPIKTKSESTSK